MTITTPKLGLRKKEATDQILAFETTPASGQHANMDTLDNALLSTLVDAKGDLIAGSAPDLAVRVAPGANGSLLMTDSAQAAGLVWFPPGTAGYTLRMVAGVPAWSNYVACHAYHSADQSIGSGGDVAIALNSERFDSDPSGTAMHDTATNNSRIHCRTAGLYVAIGSLAFAVNGTGYRQAKIRQNGTTTLAQSSEMLPIGTLITTVSVATLPFLLIAGDYVELFGLQNSGGGLNVTASSAYSPQLSLMRIG